MVYSLVSGIRVLFSVTSLKVRKYGWKVTVLLLSHTVHSVLPYNTSLHSRVTLGLSGTEMVH
jgi:hypothetical protein